MKGTLIFLLLLLFFFFPSPGESQSPSPYLKIAPPHVATCDPLDLSTTDGIYIYFRGRGAKIFNPTNRTNKIPIDATHNPPLFDLFSLNLVCGDYELAATAYNNAGEESDFSNIVSYPVPWPWCPMVPAPQETAIDHLKRLDAQIRAMLRGLTPP